MSVLIPFKKCIARPNDDICSYPLSEHLARVKQYMEKRFENEDPVIARLLGLSGICHDLVKSHAEWQVYVRGNKKRGPNHAPDGALLFSYFAYHLLRTCSRWEEYKVQWLWLTRDIADHHGTLKSVAENHWISSSDWNQMDFQGIAMFIKDLYPELSPLDISPNALKSWLDQVWDVWEEAREKLDYGYDTPPILQLMKKIQLWREMTTTLISGDRLDVSPVSPANFKKEDHDKNQKHIDHFCCKNSNHPLSRVRQKAQDEILAQLQAKPDHLVYTLEMPTGYGKTITALKIATWLGLEQGYEKIIYVAPYLSILEQTSRVIEASMKTLALEHHSLAILGDGQNEEGNYKGQMIWNQLQMETWSHTIICTSFQQLIKAIFPERAQNVLRRTFLKNSILIIDEPQIFSPEVWNVFLCGLEALAELNNLRVFFLSATMPPFDHGLTREPVHLGIKSPSNVNRYSVVCCNNMDEKDLADFLVQDQVKHRCAIMNTIADAYLVYKEIKKRDSGLDVRLIQGLMTPLHKKIEIAKIQSNLKENYNEPLCVVSTQVLEAGVDLSFQHLVRALPIMPSIVQAAGRVNRHMEYALGTMFLVPFFREGNKNTRNLIYDKNLQKITDQLLSGKEAWSETELMELIKEYYREMFRVNTYEAGMKAIVNAAEGNWPELAKIYPFGNDYFRLPIFVSWIPSLEDMKWLPEKFVFLQQKFNISSPEQIYERYVKPGFLSGLDYNKRKEFMILFHHFVVNLPVRLALQLAGKEDYLNHKIPCLFGDDVYHSVTGISSRYVEGFDNII